MSRTIRKETVKRRKIDKNEIKNAYESARARKEETFGRSGREKRQEEEEMSPRWYLRRETTLWRNCFSV